MKIEREVEPVVVEGERGTDWVLIEHITSGRFDGFSRVARLSAPPGKTKLVLTTAVHEPGWTKPAPVRTNDELDGSEDCWFIERYPTRHLPSA